MKYFFLLCALFLVGSAAPATAAEKLSLVAASGETYTVGGSADKELLLLFLSFNCPACRQSLPHLARIEKKTGTRLLLLGAIFPPEEKNLLARGKELKISFPLMHGTSEVAKQYAVEKIPTLLWFDRQGRIRERFVGEVRLQQLSECLNGVDGDKCSGLMELVARPADFVGKKIVTSGLLAAASSGSFYLSNGKESVEILPWLPREISPKAPGASLSKVSGTTPKTMQQLLGKFLTVRGQVQTGPVLKVESATIQESTKTWQNPARRRP